MRIVKFFRHQMSGMIKTDKRNSQSVGQLSQCLVFSHVKYVFCLSVVLCRSSVIVFKEIFLILFFCLFDAIRKK